MPLLPQLPIRKIQKGTIWSIWRNKWFNQLTRNLHYIASAIRKLSLVNIRDSKFTQKHYTSWTIGNSYCHNLLFKRNSPQMRNRFRKSLWIKMDLKMHIKSNFFIAPSHFPKYTQKVLHNLPVRAKYEVSCASLWYGIKIVNAFATLCNTALEAHNETYIV